LIIQFYLLSPVLVWAAKRNWRALIAVAAAIQLGTLALMYAEVIWRVPFLDRYLAANRHWSVFTTWILFVALGVVYGLHTHEASAWLVRHRRALLAAAIGCAFVAFLEARFLLLALGIDWRYSPLTTPSMIYALAFIGCFLAYERVKVPFAAQLNYLSAHTFGIFLLHMLVLKVIVILIRDHAGWVSSGVFLYVPLLVAVAVGAPLIIMDLVGKSPARKYYRYLFG
jgi:surface polysaccharide O-acyltransferase-like enzyme